MTIVLFGILMKMAQPNQFGMETLRVLQEVEHTKQILLQILLSMKETRLASLQMDYSHLIKILKTIKQTKYETLKDKLILPLLQTAL